MIAKNYLDNLDKKQLYLIKKIGNKADSLNLKAYIVGGIVRDIVLGNDNFDLDIVISSDAISFAKKMNKDIAGKLVTYPKFKTATIFTRNSGQIDFVTSRKETYSKPGALPDIKEGSFKDDLFRRDFTINAIGMSINRDNFGKLSDKFNGLDDIKKNRIRILHHNSFIDDPTRILRAIRFETRLEFQIESKTLKLLMKALDKGAVNTVSAQRYFNEFKKMLKESNPYKCLKRTRELGAEKFLGFGSHMCLRLVRQVYSRLSNLENKSIDRPTIYLAALFKKLKPNVLKENFNKFQITKKEKKLILQWYESDDAIALLSEIIERV